MVINAAPAATDNRVVREPTVTDLHCAKLIIDRAAEAGLESGVSVDRAVGHIDCAREIVNAGPGAIPTETVEPVIGNRTTTNVHRTNT